MNKFSSFGMIGFLVAMLVSIPIVHAGHMPDSPESYVPGSWTRKLQRDRTPVSRDTDVDRMLGKSVEHHGVIVRPYHWDGNYASHPSFKYAPLIIPFKDKHFPIADKPIPLNEDMAKNCPMRKRAQEV